MNICKKVPSSWPKKKFNGIAFIGGAPGDYEVSFGKPMAGPNLRLLTQACQVAGIDLDECFVGNVFEEQLPEDDIDECCAGLEESKTWDVEFPFPAINRGKFLKPKYWHNLERLEKEMMKLKPNVIIPLGGTALWAFNGIANIQKHRGAIAEANMIYGGAKLLPTFQPSKTLIKYTNFPIMVMDLVKALGERHTPKISYTPREIWIEPTLDDIREYMEVSKDAPYLSIDIETIPSFRQITCIGFADSVGRAIVIPFCDKREPNNSYWDSAEEEAEALGLVQELCQRSVVKIGQNFTYDLQWILTMWGIKVLGYSEDTRLQHHALYLELPKDLGFLGSCYAREKSWKMYRGNKAEKRDE